MNNKILTKNEEETMNIAENFETEKFAGMVICLDGELGSGKTVFVKGFARGLGIDDAITSPTFNIIKEYDTGELPLYHMDVYRVSGETKSIGIEDYFNKNGITIIEWSENIADILPADRLDVKFSIVDENSRVIRFIPYGKQYEDLCNSVL